MSDSDHREPSPEDSPSSDESETDRFQRLRERAKQGGKGVAKRAGDLYQSAKEGASTVGAQGSEALSAAWTRAGTAASGAIDRGKELPSQLRDLVLRECAVPVFMLPTGVNRSDFICRFDFHEAVDKLEHGVLVRPRLDVWAGRHDVDRNALAQILTKQFRAQLDEERRRASADHSAKLREIRHEVTVLEAARDTDEKRIETGLKRVTWGILGMFFLANPLFDLVFLALALFGGTQVVSRAGPWFRATFSSGASKKKADKEERKLTEEMERELSASSDSFRTAIGNLEIRVHPVLNALLLDFAEVELVTVPASVRAEDDHVPDVGPLLTEHAYLSKVPWHLHVLVDAHAG